MEQLSSEVEHHIMHLKAMKSERQRYIKLSSFSRGDIHIVLGLENQNEVQGKPGYQHFIVDVL